MNVEVLQTKPAKSELDAYKLTHPELETFYKTSLYYRNDRYSVALGYIAGPITAIIVSILLVHDFEKLPSSIHLLLITAIVFFLILPVFVRFLRMKGASAYWNRLYVLSTFAKDNHYLFTANKVLATVGIQRALEYENKLLAIDIITTPDYEVYHTVNLLKRPTLYNYVKVPLSTNLPNMLIWAKSTPWLLNFDLHKVPEYRNYELVKLEGEFEKNFTLIIEPGEQNQIIARQFFDPQLIELLTEQGVGHMIEIINDALYIYDIGVDPLHEGHWLKVQKIYDTIGKRLKRKSSIYYGARQIEAKSAI